MVGARAGLWKLSVAGQRHGLAAGACVRGCQAFDGVTVGGSAQATPGHGLAGLSARWNSRFRYSSRTHSPVGPAAMAVGSVPQARAAGRGLPTGTGLPVTWLVAGSIRTTASDCCTVSAQAEPSQKATCDAPGHGDRRGHVAGRWIDPLHLRRPQRAGARGFHVEIPEPFHRSGGDVNPADGSAVAAAAVAGHPQRARGRDQRPVPEAHRYGLAGDLAGPRLDPQQVAVGSWSPTPGHRRPRWRRRRRVPAGRP